MRLRTLFLHCLILLLPLALAYHRAGQPTSLDNQTGLLDQNTNIRLCNAQIDTAIDVLIDRLLWDEEYSGMSRRWSSAMAVLVEIGPSALPQLIEAILAAPVMAAVIKYGDGSQPSAFMVKCFTANLQIRAAIALGMIGDSRALPVLTNLQCQNSNDGGSGSGQNDKLNYSDDNH